MGKKNKRKKRRNRHHIIPKSRGGRGGLENIARVDVVDHQDYHKLFDNKKPDEIVEYLVNYYWNGQWEHVREAYNKHIDYLYDLVRRNEPLTTKERKELSRFT